MAYQASQNNTSFPFILSGVGFIKDTQTLLTQGSRSVALKQYTVMSQVASSGKWVPWLNANLGGTTGTQYPLGILMSDDVTAAALVAGDVTGANILYCGHGCEIDASQIVFDKGDDGLQTACTLASIPTVPTNSAMVGEQYLIRAGLIPVTTVAGDNFEN